MDWIKHIRELSVDVKHPERKPWLRTALKSHCEGYAERNGKSITNLNWALDTFFYKPTIKTTGDGNE